MKRQHEVILNCLAKCITSESDVSFLVCVTNTSNVSS